MRFKKSELKNGMIITCRNGEKYVIAKDCNLGGSVCDIGIEVGEFGIKIRESGNLINISLFTDDLLCKDYRGLDVIKVEIQDQANKNNLLEVWNNLSFTKEEIEKIKALKILGFKYIARDKNEGLYAYDCKPKKGSLTWYADGEVINMNDGFDQLSFFDDEPLDIEKVLENN